MTLTPEQAKSQLINFKDKNFRIFQEEAINFITNSTKKVKVLKAPPGCHDANQKILLADGQLKRAIDINIGDFLINEKGEFQKVLRLIRGKGKMFKISPVKGSPFIVNEEHILTLSKTGEFKDDPSKGTLVDVCLKDYFKWSNNKKHHYKLIRKKVDKFKYENNALPIEPYMLGLLLGDGTMINGVIGICNPDTEIIDYIKEYCEQNELKIRQSASDPYSYYFSKKNNRNANNFFSGNANKMKIARKLVFLNLFGCGCERKFVPHIYKTSSFDNRLEILAGLLDTDGYCYNNCYDYVSKSKQLAEDVIFLARSLGLAAYIKECAKSCQNNFTGKYFRVSISGDCSIIPCRVERKKACERNQKKDSLVTGFKIEKLKIGNYYGWELNGNERYLLDDFTLTHNSGKSLTGVTAGIIKGNFTYLVESKYLQTQITNDFPNIKSIWGRNNYVCLLDQSKSCAECVSTKKSPCPYIEDCLYRIAKEIAVQSPYRICNFQYFISEIMYAGKLRGKPFTIVDEADVMEKVLTSNVNLEFTERSLFRLGLTDGPKYKTTGAKEGLSSWKDFASEAKLRSMEIARSIQQDIDLLDIDDTDTLLRKKQELETFIHIKERCDIFINNMDKEWIMEEIPRKGSRQGKLIFKPTWLSPDMADKYLWSHSDSWVLVSGTFPPIPVLAKQLGLDTDDIDYMEVPSVFDPAKSPVYMAPVADVTFKNMETALPKLIKAIKVILHRHIGQRGMIHCVSWDLCKKIMNGVNDKRLITHTSENRNEIINEFLNIDGKFAKDAVLCSPSIERGVDGKDDIVRFVVIPKCPFLNISDKLVSSRLYTSGIIGKLWFDADALSTVEQMSGRCVRSTSDWGTIYILDNKVNDIYTRKPSLFSQSFQNQISWEDLDLLREWEEIFGNGNRKGNVKSKVKIAS